MKKFKKIFYLIALLMLPMIGMLFGCTPNYENMKLLSSLDSNTIVLIYGDEERNSQTFELSIDGVGGDISTTIKRPYISVAGLVEVSLNKVENSNKTNVTVRAINYGQTDVVFTTEEGGKTYSITIKCELPVEGLAKKSTYNPYAVIGQTTKISTTGFDFVPSNTTQRDVEFAMMGAYEGVELKSDGTIIASADAQNGRFGVHASSRDNPSVYTEFEVVVLRGAESITASYNGIALAEETEIYFSANMLEESYKIFEVLVQPINYNFVLNYNIFDKYGNKTSHFDEINQTISSDLFEINIIDSRHIGVTAKKAGDEILEITASIAGYGYVSEPIKFNLHSENVAKSISVLDMDENIQSNTYTIYEDYKGRLGKEFKISLGGEGIIKNQNFVIRQAISSQNASKLRILTGKRDEVTGKYVEARLYKADSTDYDIFTSGTTLYLIADPELIEGDETLDALTFDFVACGTMGRLGSETKTTITFNLRRGVSSMRLDGHEENQALLVPIKQVVNDNVLVGETNLIIVTNTNEYTDFIYTNSQNLGYELQENVVAYQNSIVDGEVRQYIFKIYGIKEGDYILSFYTQNGLKFDVKVRVFTKINKITLTTESVEQNSDIGKIDYTTTDDNFKTLDNGSIALRLDGSATLNFNAYFDKYLEQTTFQKITYEFEEEGIVIIDSMNKMRGVKEGETNVKATIFAYDDEENGEYEINFRVKVYVAVQNVYLNTKNVTLYTQSTLSDFVENGKTNKQEYGEHEFVLKINPDLASISEDDITISWTGSEASNLNIQKEYVEAEKKLVLKVSLNSLSAGREEGRAKLIISVVQYGRMFVKEADILFKNATKVSQIYDIKQEIAGVYTNATQKDEAPISLNNYDFKYYLYFDIRDANQDGKIMFNLDAKTYPQDALNPKLNYIYVPIEGYENVLSISGNQITIENAGLAYINVCAVDSYSAQNNTYTTIETILIKVADGNSQSTALEISKPSDLIKINQNVQNLNKFYILTKNINLASQSSWTPIGYIDGNEYEFNGYVDGLLDNNSGDIVCATISGLKFSLIYNNIGLFAKLGRDAQIKNLNVSVLNANINTTNAVNLGAICGQNAGECHTITAVVNTSNIIAGDGSNIGGISGQNTGIIFNCYALGELNVQANAYVGGLTGLNNATIDGNTIFFNDKDMAYSYNSEIIINAQYTNGAVGGIAGYSNGKLVNVSFDGVLTGTNNVGGIAGVIESNSQEDFDLINSFASGFINGTENIGGLVGYANNVKVSNSSVNMFDSLYPETHITGTNKVGGLIGKAENLTLQNAYARSYIKPERLENGDINAVNYVGGLIGYSSDVTANKVYSIQKLVGTENVGGLLGYANNIDITNAFERNTYLGEYEIIAGISEGSYSVEYFYSSNEEIDWTGWSFATNKDQIITGNYDWYKPNSETYPYLIYTNNPAKLLTVEAPTSISVQAKENNYLTNKDIDGNNLPNHTYVLFKGKTSQIKFTNLFNVNVLPNDDLLNISEAYSIISSDTNVIQITGKTKNDYRLKLNSTGKVELTITSKMNSEASTKITLYVLNAVSGFNLSINETTLLVNNNYELVQKLSNNYVNNDNFYIKFTNENNGKILINNDTENEKIVKNNEKIFIKSTKSGEFSINYQLFVKITIDNDDYNISLGNDNGSSIDSNEKTITKTFIYGIKDFSSDTHQLETGLNDVTNLTYTLTGDDLRIKEDSVYSMPHFEWKITLGSAEMSDYWNVKNVLNKIYFNDNLFVGTETEFNEKLQIEDNRITKIEFVLEISANIENVQNYFKAHSEEQQFNANLTVTTAITSESDMNSDNKDISWSETASTLVVKRQKIDNITLTFYANAEIGRDNNNQEYYNINEVPSNAIINGQTSIMKIALVPTNAEVKAVKVSYSNTSGYVMSMNQVLKNEYFDNNNKLTRYLDRKPYAVATENGKGIELYHKESNFVSENATTYDGYLYVAFIVASKISAGEAFTITVDAIYTNGYHYVTSTNLVSRLKSNVEFGYNFEYTFNGVSQSANLEHKFIIPVGVEKEFYVDYTELLEADDVVNIENKVSPNAVGFPDYVKLSKTDDKVKYSYLGNSSYRVYYKITATEAGKKSFTATMTKTQNSIQTTYTSSALEILAAPFVVTGVDIVDGSNNILTVPQSSPRDLDVNIKIDTAPSNYKNDGTFIENIASQINTLKNELVKNYKYWYGKKIIDPANTYTQLTEGNSVYENYYVNKNSNGIVSINVRTPETTDLLYLEVPFDYSNIGDVSFNAQQNVNIVGENFKASGYSHTFRDFVTLNLTNDISQEHAIPIFDETGFINMSNGTNDQVFYYALDNNITLTDYEPRNLENISFDGNGYTITITNFKTKIDDAYISKYGLFDTINSNSIVKNLTINYLGLDKTSTDSDEITTTLDTSVDGFNITEMHFGGVAVTNNGIIYNTKTISENNEQQAQTLNFVGDITRQTYVAGITCENNGYISYSTSKLNIEANCGFVAGFVAINAKKISNSKVILTEGISNTLTSADMSLTGGFVARNRGDIFGCYVSGGTVSSRSTLGGFVNQNTGNIDSCHTNVRIESTLRASGFVYQNEGMVTSSYSASTMEANNSALTPFIGTDTNARSLNTGTIDDCYFVNDSSDVEDFEAIKLSTGDAKSKNNFAKFVFADDDSLNGTWTISSGTYPQLVDANLEIFCQLKFKEVKTENDENGNPYSYYLWEFVERSPEYGKEKNGIYNPRIIKNYKDWNDKITFINNETESENQSDYLVILCDLVAERDSAPASSTQTFKGKLLGNNMQISNLYLRADSTSTNKCFGLFASIESALVKDIKLVARQVVASAARCVGTLAGYIDKSDICNIIIDGTDVEAVQGRNMVGAFAGLINNSAIQKINVSGSVNAGYIENNTNLKNYKDSDIDNLTGNEKGETPYSYSGTFAGAIVGNTTAKLINITGENKVIGFYAGSCVGLIDTSSTLSLASTEVVLNQYVRAYGFAGGLVGENRGAIDRCFVEHEKSIQYAIDSNTTNKNTISGRNLTFFAGSPKFIGGLVGFNNGGAIQNSYSKLDVRVSQYSTLASGGLVGMSVAGTIQNCYATGSVTNRYIIGGLVGVVTNQAYLKRTYNNGAGKDVRFDTYNIFDTLAYISDNNNIELNNNLASNKWIVPQSTTASDTDPEFIAQATIGLLIGQVVNPSRNVNNNIPQVTLATTGNYINTQVLKTGNNVDTRVNPGNITISELSVLKDLSILQNVSTSDKLIEAITKITIGAYHTSLNPYTVNLANRTEEEYSKADCTVNNVLLSFENLLNKDEMLLDLTKGLFKDWNNISYNIQLTTDANSPIYPEIIRNINAE